MTPFKPPQAGTKNIDVSSSSQAVALGIDPQASDTQIRVHNDGSATVWLNFGIPTVTASLTTSYPLASGACEVVTIPAQDGKPLYAAAIAAGSTGKVYFTPGIGN